ncbi:MAG: hypothetical protein ACYDHO_03790 [Gaiellaceae bacterium]
MKRLTRFLGNEDGIAMATVVALIVVLSIISVILIDQVTSESNRAAAAATSDSVFQASEAGIDAYIAKLIDNPGYYDMCVTNGESTRRRNDNMALVPQSTSSTSCTPSGTSIWTPGVKWTYPSGKNAWTSGVGDASANTTAVRGYAYNLMVTPPYTPSGSIAGTDYIDVVSTGCKVLDPSATPLQCNPRIPMRSIEVHLRRTTPADFQFMMKSMPTSGSGVVCWASTVYGTMYSTGDIYVCGAKFYGNVLAENRVVVASGYANPPTVVSPKRIYDKTRPNIRDVIKNPVNFSDLLASVSQVQRNSDLNTPTTTFDDSTASAWRINFTSNGKMQVWKCVNSSAPEASLPFCGGDLALTSAGVAKLGKTFSVTNSTAEYPDTGTVFVGPNSNGKIDSFTYSSKTATSFSGGTGIANAHAGGERVSIVSTGISWPVPKYNDVVPTNGAVYTGQDAIISWPKAISGVSETDSNGSPTSKVNGQVTIASNGNIVIAGNIHYASEAASNGIGGANNDVLGMIAQGDFVLAQYAPNKLWFRAATMAVNGSWGDYACRNGPDRDGSVQGSSSLTFVGTSAYGSNVGCINGSGGYGYRDGSGNLKNVYRITDDGTAPECPSTAPGCTSFNALKYLVPPYFPPLNGIETVFFREMPPAYQAPAAPSS